MLIGRDSCGRSRERDRPPARAGARGRAAHRI